MRLRGSIAIDLGTTNTLIWVAGRGLGSTNRPRSRSTRLRARSPRSVTGGRPGRQEPEDIEIIYPLRDGVIADLSATALMLNGFLHRANRHPGPLRPSALVCVPSRATWVERRSVAAALEARRPRATVRLVDEPVAAAAGAGVDLTSGTGAFMVDLGGGTTEIAVVSGARVVRAQSLRLAGNAMDDAIIHAARTEMGLILGRKAATGLKMELGLTGGTLGWAEAVGIDAAHRVPRVDRVSGQAGGHRAGTYRRGHHPLGGGDPVGHPAGHRRGRGARQNPARGRGALLPGLASRIESSSDIAVVVVDDPLRCVIRGAAELLERGDEFAGVGLAK